MSDFPILDQMGVKNPSEIARYALYSLNGNDVLRLVYKRKKGSILPVSRKYRFPQVKKNIIVDSGTRQTETMFESSNEFRNAIAELDRLLSKKTDATESRKLILDELRLLEEESALRLNYIRKLMEELK